MTRLQQIEHQGLAPALPPAGPAAHLLGYLFDAGPVGYGAMGEVPLSHGELAAWQHNTGVELQAWESRALRRLSTEYVSASNQATEPDCPPFYLPADELQDRRQDVASRVRGIFGALTKPQPAKAH